MTTATARPRRAWVANRAQKHRELAVHAVLYLAAGSATTLLQALLYVIARGPLAPQPANLVAIALTTIANTEFHRRVTFADAEDKPLRRHLQSVGTFAFYAVSGSAALFLLDAAVRTPSLSLETTVLALTSFAGGTARFLILRYWVFRRRVKMTT